MAFFCLKLANQYIKADDFRVNYVEMQAIKLMYTSSHKLKSKKTGDLNRVLFKSSANLR